MNTQNTLNRYGSFAVSFLMLKKEVIDGKFTIQQYQFGYISINMEYYLDDAAHQHQRTLLAINIYVIHIDQSVWILDSGFNDQFEIPYIQSKLKTDFIEIIDQFKSYRDVNLILSHFHPDHSGGLIKYFDQIHHLNWRLFYNQKHFDPQYYQNYPEIYQWIRDDFNAYTNKMDIQYQQYFNIVCQGGHTPDHMVLSFNDNAYIYTADIIPTVYHIEHVPTGEKNADQNRFIKNRESVKSLAKSEKSCLLLPHAPNHGFHQL